MSTLIAEDFPPPPPISAEEPLPTVSLPAVSHRTASLPAVSHPTASVPTVSLPAISHASSLSTASLPTSPPSVSPRSPLPSVPHPSPLPPVLPLHHSAPNSCSDGAPPPPGIPRGQRGPAPFHPADTDQDGTVDKQEFVSWALQERARRLTSTVVEEEVCSYMVYVCVCVCVWVKG